MEETSHFCHIHYCLHEYGSPPVLASTELIGSIDKYLNLELIYRNKGIQTPTEFQEIECFKGVLEPGHNIEHYIGHYFGRIKAHSLREIWQQQGVTHSNKAYARFYRMDGKSQIIHMLERAGTMDFGDRTKDVLTYFRNEYGIKTTL